MDRHELAWAAGFFDGDGWAGFSGALDRRTRQPHAQINQAGETGVPETLEWFRNSVDCAGHLGGPVVLLGRLPMYSWTASSRSDVEHVWDLLSPWLCDSKSAEFRAALRLPLDTAWARTRTPEDLAWAAGLFDAEGSTSLLKHRSHEGYLIPELAITQASNLGVPGELTRFQRAVSGRGRIYGPFTQKRARRPVYRWKSSAVVEVNEVLQALWPFLSGIRRGRAEAALRTLAAQAPLPRGNPAWGNRKSHCVHGHEYAIARIRPYRSRTPGGTERRNSQQCLVCVRLAAKAYYERRKPNL